MPTLHPQILKKNGRAQFVILPYKEFRALQEMLEDAEDVLDLRRAREENAGQPTYTLEQVKLRLGLSPRRKPRRKPASRRRKGY